VKAVLQNSRHTGQLGQWLLKTQQSAMRHEPLTSSYAGATEEVFLKSRSSSSNKCIIAWLLG
jgi:hypothetical protein